LHHSDHVIPDQPRPVPPSGALYFVGVGGAGMSALAQVLAERGRSVAGADPGISPAVRERLERAGVAVYQTHDAAQVPADASAVIVSDAIPKNNAEVAEAERRGLPIIRRPELLGALMNEGRGIAIAGTHGKTTTTGMVASVLLAADLDPTIFLGGDLPAIGGNARNGAGDLVLAESCEAYDGFLYLHPQVAVVLNIEADHLDYHGDEAHVLESFARFLMQVTPEGVVILCGDDAHASAAQFYSPAWAEVWTYQLTPPREQGLYIADADFTGPRPAFTIMVKAGAAPDDVFTLGRVTLGVPGRHNVLNALAAASVGLALHIPAEKIIAGLEAFTGTGRRFEKLGDAGGVLVIDDYAHHPTELRATLAAARAAYPDRRIVAVFQPHLPSRTRDLMDEFAHALAGTTGSETLSLFELEETEPLLLTGADAVYLTDIYLAREQPMEGVTSGVLARKTENAKPGLPVVYVADKNELPARLLADVKPGDLVLTMGAGDIRRAGEGLVELLSHVG